MRSCNHDHVPVADLLILDAGRKIDRRDPTGTTDIRQAFERDLVRHINEFKKVIRQALVKEDVLGLRGESFRDHVMFANRRLTTDADTPGVKAFKFVRDPAKHSAFMEWIIELWQRKVIQMETRRSPFPWGQTKWAEMYLRRVYERTIDQLIESQHIPKQPIDVVFRQPIHVERSALIFNRVFTELKGIGEAVGQHISRVLSEGIIRGDGVMKIARNMAKEIDSIGVKRARLLARTEVIATHADATLNSLEAYQKRGVYLVAELSTAGDNKVCAKCMELEARNPYTLKQARGIIPAHPNCRCAWIPVVQAPPVKEVPEKPKIAVIGKRTKTKKPKEVVSAFKSSPDPRLMAEIDRRWSDEDKARLTEGAKRVVENSEIYIQVPSKTFEEILRDGRFYNQYHQEAHRSLAGNVAGRRKVEDALMGTQGLADDDRPIYAYASDLYAGELTAEEIYAYGDFPVQLKKDRVINRATIMEGDSISANQALSDYIQDFDDENSEGYKQAVKYLSALPTDMSNPDYRMFISSRPGGEKYLGIPPEGKTEEEWREEYKEFMGEEEFEYEEADWEKDHNGTWFSSKESNFEPSSVELYVEVQIVGGVTLDDIAVVHLDHSADSEMAVRLTELGIPFTTPQSRSEERLKRSKSQ